MKHTITTPKHPVLLEIEFDDVCEIEELREALTTWTPHGGWSEVATEFFEILQKAIDIDKQGNCPCSSVNRIARF